MGAEIHSKRNSTGCCSIWGLHNSAKNDIWSLYQEDRPQKNGQHFESLLPWHLMQNARLQYDKEKVKQTILKHETTFRHQLQELHRLYGKQRELMNKFRRSEVKSGHTEEAASSLSPFSTHISSQDTKRGWHVSPVPSVQLVFGQSSQSEFSSKQSFLGFSKEKNVIPFPPRGDGNSKLREPPGAKGKMSPRRVIDLEIPADACTNDEEELCYELPRVESNSATCTKEILHNQGVKISFYDALNNHLSGDVSRSTLPLKRRNELADLNEPILLEETSVSGSADDPADLSSHWGNVKSEDKSVTPNSVLNSFWKDTSLSAKKNDISGTCLKRLQLNETDRKQQFTCDFNSKMMQPDSLSRSRVAYSQDPSVAFQSSNDKDEKSNEIATSEHGRTGHRTKRKLFGVDIFEADDQSLVTATVLVHAADSSARSFCSSIDGVSYQNGISQCPQLNVECSRGDSFAGFNVANNTRTLEVVPKESRPVDLVKSVENLDDPSEWKPSNVSRAAMKPSNVFQEVLAAEYNILPADCQSKLGILKELPLQSMDNVHCAEQPRINEYYHHLNLDSLQNCSQQFFKNNTSLSSEKLEKTPPVSIHDIDDSNAEVHLPSSTKLIKDFPTGSNQGISRDLDVSRKSSERTCSADGLKSGAVPIEKMVSEHHPGGKCLNLEEPINDIDLNLSLVEEEDPSSPSLPAPVVKLAITEVDLEAPTVTEPETGKPIELSSDGPKEPCEELIRLAAEAIVAISVSVEEDIVDDGTYKPAQDKPNECLQWFVDVVSSYECDDQSNKSDLNIKGNDGLIAELIPDGMDDFEYMTLQLEDLTNDHCYHNYSEPVLENQEEEETKVSTLSRRPRRGQARRGRQRKDFQRDVLPSLISLSKLEVTEDFQTFEELLRATGSTWQSSLSRRSTAKSSRGRRRSRAAPPTPTHVAEPVCSPPSEQKPVSGEVQPEDITLTGWGKRTRRLPRQRHVTKNE